MGNGQNCSNWSLENGINRSFICSRVLSFSFSHIVIFSFSKCRRWSLESFQLSPSRCKERQLAGQFRRKETKEKHVSHLFKVAWAPRSRNCLLPFSPSTRSSHFPSLPFYHFSPSFLVPLKLFPLQFTLFSFLHSPVHLDRRSGYSLHQRKRTVVRGL